MRIERVHVGMLLVLVAAIGECPALAEDVDSGGLTFDFSAISEKRFSVVGAQMLPVSGWKGDYCSIHHREVAGNDPRRKVVKQGVEFRTEGDDLVIIKKPELVKLVGDDVIAANVSGGMSQLARLPDDEGGTYRVSLTYRSRHEIGRFSGILITPIREKDGGVSKGVNAAGDDEPRLQIHAFNDIWSDALTWAKDIRVPKGCDALYLVVRIDGVGELRFRDVSVTKVSLASEITLKASPGDFLDGTFAVSEGQCALPCWVWKKNDPEMSYRRDGFTFVLTLPKGYRFIESTAGICGKETPRALADGSTEYRIPSEPRYGGCLVGDEFKSWPVLSALIRAEPGAGKGEMRFFAEYEGRRVTDLSIVKLFTVPAIRAKVPRRYGNGFYQGGPYADFKTKEGREGFADLFSAAGATWVVKATPDPATLRLWREKGVRRMVSEYSFCANGYRVGDASKAPASDRFVALTGVRDGEIKRAVCPVSVYAEGEFFRTQTLPALQKWLKGCDGLWGNWEPYMFVGKGCMCERCRAVFAKYVGVADEEMAKDWPQELAFGHKWYDKVQVFRSLEHAKLVKTLDKYVTAYGGGTNSVGFVPGVAWNEMSSDWRRLGLAPEAQPYYYAGALKWIDPWGPYPCWDAATPYAACDGWLLSYFVVAKDVGRQVVRDYGEKAPQLMALPHGVQCCTWFTQPESVAISCDSFFFNGWGCSIVYAFPKGYDARYWHAFAAATTRAAEYEDYVLCGRRCDDEVKVVLDPAKPYPLPRERVYAHILKYATNVPLLQHVAYELKGKTIVAVFNFADRDVAYATITVKGISRKVAVGATRCRVFTFE